MDKPFDMQYVLTITTRNMIKSIDTSIKKTFERIKDFESNPVKSQEILETLSKLHNMRKQLDEISAAI